jgi:SAM-dependent methyltransferase
MLRVLAARAAGYLARAQRFAEGMARSTPASEPAPAAPPPVVEVSAPEEPQLDRVQKALLDIDPAGSGLEIGPGHAPIAPRSAGFRIETLDHATADELRAKYADDKSVEGSRIEEVDHIWRGEPLDEVVHGRRYDFIIASHVIEHVPDFVSFLQQCGGLLKPGGLLSLIIPDKRYCFDHLRWPSTTGDVLQAFLEKRRRHLPGTVFDAIAHECSLAGQIAWGEGERGALTLNHSLAEAQRRADAARATPGYTDCHAWRFTPASFSLILAELRMLGLLDLEVARTFPSAGCEFFVSLRPTDRPPPAVDRIALYEAVQREARLAIPTEAP